MPRDPSPQRQGGVARQIFFGVPPPARTRTRPFHTTLL
jgi:hypothetical protein